MSVGLVIAVKNLSQAKSRLAWLLNPIQRAQLVMAMLEDTLHATRLVIDPGHTVIVTADPRIYRLAIGVGVRVLEDTTPPHHHDPLNCAFMLGERVLCQNHEMIVMLPGDLPALQACELGAALDQAYYYRRSFIADRHHCGTTALFGYRTELLPSFGSYSATSHRRSGAVELHGHWPGLCCDIDTGDDLDYVHSLSLGPQTTAILKVRAEK